MNYKYCMVPQCRSTTIKTPEKLFIHVPINIEIRRKWFKIARRKDALSLSTKSPFYFCEDHFDLPNDMNNYTEYHIMGKVSRVCMKPGCVPTKFECQEDRSKRMCSLKKRPNILKKQRKTLIAECLNEPEQRSRKRKNLKGDPKNFTKDLGYDDENVCTMEPLADQTSQISTETQSSDLKNDNTVLSAFNTLGDSIFSNQDLSTENAPKLLTVKLEAPDPLLEDEVFENDEYINQNSVMGAGKSIKTEIQEEFYADQDINQEISAPNYCWNCELNQISAFSIHKLKSQVNAVNFYTGLKTFEKFMFVFNSLSYADNKLDHIYGKPPDHLDALEQFFITLLILKKHREFEDIAITYKTSTKQVENIFITWIRFMALQWRNDDIFSFNYDNITAECPNENPPIATTEILTVQNRNTVQFLIDIAPNGLISNISLCNGSSPSDQPIVDNKDDIKIDMLSDEVMVDTPDFSKEPNRYINLNTPEDRRIASEQVIEVLKTFYILTQEMNKTETLLASDITYVVAMLVNFILKK